MSKIFQSATSGTPRVLVTLSPGVPRIFEMAPAPLDWDEIPGEWDEVPGNFDETGSQDEG